jgi:hypothetical protein
MLNLVFNGGKASVCTGIHHNLWEICLLVVSLEACRKLENFAPVILHDD